MSLIPVIIDDILAVIDIRTTVIINGISADTIVIITVTIVI